MRDLPRPELRPTLRAVAADVDTLGRHRRSALRDRLGEVLRTLGGRSAPGPTRELVAAVVATVDPLSASELWLLVATVGGAHPTPERLAALHRRARLDGVLPVLAAALPHLPPGMPPRPGRWPRVSVVTGEVLVDVSDTAAAGHVTGIQRVTRETARRWARDHPVLLVGWDDRQRALVPLGADSRERVLAGVSPAPGPVVDADVVVPWRSTYLLPELATEHRRTASLRSLVLYADSRTAMIGFDCVPVTTAETVGDGMGGGFALMLAAAAHVDQVVAISEAAAQEYRGWRAMLQGAGQTGPLVTAVPLATEGGRAGVADETAARALTDTGLPVVLAVGSHEPRKNHLAVLHAAELLWREGVQFELVFVGGRAWRSERFDDAVGRLQAEGRPVRSLTGVADELLWGLYAVATVMVFPSLNEGFGLPITEALAAGTPVVTSAFGSMAEIAADGGCVLVDPRDDHDLAGGIRRVLLEPGLAERLRAEADRRPVTTWDDYAARTWTVLTGTADAATGERP